MKTIIIILAIITLLLLLSMLTCGLWTSAKGLPDAAGKLFHKNLGIAAISMSMLTIVLMLFRLR